MRGRFITFEGIDCAGKSTNIKILEQWFKDQGRDVVVTREPGGTPVGEKIREVLLNNKMSSMAEVLMFAAARAEHLHQLIYPSIEAGKIVISDRFSDSTYAYQASGRGLYEQVSMMERIVHSDFEPHYTLFFDIPLDESLKRLYARTGEKPDVFESEKDEFRKRLYDGYHFRFKQNSHRMIRIDAMQTPEAVAAQVINWAEKAFF